MHIKSYTSSAIAFCILALTLSVLQFVGAPLALASLPIGLGAVAALGRKAIGDAVLLVALAIAVPVLNPPLVSVIDAVLVAGIANIIYALGLKRGAEASATDPRKVIISDREADTELHPGAVMLVANIGDGDARLTPILGSEDRVLEALRNAHINTGSWK